MQKIEKPPPSDCVIMGKIGGFASNKWINPLVQKHTKNLSTLYLYSYLNYEQGVLTPCQMFFV